jgi:hypothetical protein
MFASSTADAGWVGRRDTAIGISIGLAVLGAIFAPRYGSPPPAYYGAPPPQYPVETAPWPCPPLASRTSCAPLPPPGPLQYAPPPQVQRPQSNSRVAAPQAAPPKQATRSQGKRPSQAPYERTPEDGTDANSPEIPENMPGLEIKRKK